MVPEGGSLQTLIDSLGFEPTALVVELNESVVDKDTLKAVELHAQDKVEILQFVGGG
ncbi:MAG: sulfur carrier protein ThiS [Candidatus Omnitrophica bacterium]|nr:sulfur carrier protein ThiS [Candidatus Omnitrophota bacterium]